MGEQNALVFFNTSEGRCTVFHSVPLCDFYKACCMTFQCFNIFDEITYEVIVVLPEFSSEPRFEPELWSSSGKFSSKFIIYLN